MDVKVINESSAFYGCRGEVLELEWESAFQVVVFSCEHLDHSEPEGFAFYDDELEILS